MFSCALLSTILNDQPITKTSNFSGNVNNVSDKTAPQSTPKAPSFGVKNCKVVLEDIFSFCDAGKLRMLRSSQEKTHKTCSHHTNEEVLLSHMQVKPPIAWGKLTDECRVHLDTAHSKFTKTGALPERLNQLESTLSAEAATPFGHSPPPNQNLVGQSPRTKFSINLIKEKNLLLA